MPRLNIKSTKEAIVKLLKENNESALHEQKVGYSDYHCEHAEFYLLKLAKELEIDIKPEEHK